MLSTLTVDVMRSDAVAATLVALTIGASTLVFAPAVHAQVPASDDAWLVAVNDFRSSLRLEPVREDPAMSKAARLHSIYMVETGFIEHGEKADSPWRTPAGHQAGEQSNVAGGTGTPPTQEQAVDLWIEGPFHRIGLMRPAWRTTGFALETGMRDGERRWGATLNVIGDLTGSSSANWPIVWPNARRTAATSFLQFERVEWPDPAVGCPKANDTDYGTIITASFGPGAAPKVKSVRLRAVGGDPVPICKHTAATYKKDDYTDVGWRLLGENNTVMVLPRVVLSPGTTYQGRITLKDGRRAPIRFTTAAAS